MRRGLPRWLVALVAAVYVFLHLPILVLVVFSFNASKFSVEWTGFSLEWYRRLLERDDILHGLRASLIVGVAATLISTLLGTFIALGLARHKFRGRRVLEALLYVPIVTPEIVTGISLLAFFQWTFRWLGWHLGLHTVILAHVSFSIAYVAIVVAARLRTFDASLEEAAMDLGATEWRAFRRVTLPAISPGFIAAGLLALTISFDDYVITSLVAGVDSTTLPMVIYAMARRGANPSINAISALIVVIFGALILISERLREA